MKNNCNSNNSKRGVLFVNFASLLLLLLLFPVVRSSCICRSGAATPDSSLNGLKLAPSVFRKKKTETFSQVSPRSWTHNDFQKETCSRFQHPGILFLNHHPGFISVFTNEMKKKLKQNGILKNVRFGETANQQGIDDTNLNDASVSTNPQNNCVSVTKYTGNGRVVFNSVFKNEMENKIKQQSRPNNVRFG